jgi:SAM-dependent methyltransferase
MNFPNLTRILEIPFLYLTYRNVVGGKRATATFLKEYVRPKDQDRILDIGCGPAELVEHISNVEYMGFDSNPAYIDSAKKKYGDRAHFFCETVDDVTLEKLGTFDLVIALGILHHLDDKESLVLLELANKALKKGGRLITFDGCYIEGQSKIAQFIISRDRGQFVRTQDGYVNLASKVFSRIEVGLRDDLLRIPYNHVILECTK